MSRGNRLREARERLGLTQAQLAERAGTSQPQIRRLESGERKLSAEWAERLAAHLHTTPEWLSFGSGALEVAITGMVVEGVSKAGTWQEIGVFDTEHEGEVVAVAKDPRFPRARQYALKICGDSMDRRFPDGSYVTCVAFDESGLPIRDGLIVHVERHRGGLVETTVKKISGKNGSVYLIPESSNPVHKPIVLDGDESTEIVIKGIVTGRWEPFDI